MTCSCCGCRGHNRQTCPLLKKYPKVKTFGISYDINNINQPNKMYNNKMYQKINKK